MLLLRCHHPSRSISLAAAAGENPSHLWPRGWILLRARARPIKPPPAFMVTACSSHSRFPSPSSLPPPPTTTPPRRRKAAMVRTPCCDGKGVKKGPWAPEEDKLLVDYVQANGSGNWRLLPKLAGLNRCGKSCRLRWTNYLRPDIKRGPFTPEEHNSILQLHAIVGNKWSMIAAQLPGRTDNEIKNYWNTHLKKQLRPDAPGGGEGGPAAALAAAAAAPCPAARHAAQWETARLEAEARLSLLSSSSTAAAAATATTASSSSSSAAEHAADIYLRLWNSEVGEAFRGSAGHGQHAGQAAAAAAATTAGAPAPAQPAPGGDDYSSAASTNGTDAAADDYEAFLDLAMAEEFALLHGRLGAFSVLPPPDVLVAEASCLFTPFE